jgi:two-component system OmpR family sensor kinase
MTRRIPSLRARLTLINVALLAVGLVLIACGSVWGLRSYLVDRVDDDLRSMRAAQDTDLTAASLRELTGRGGVLHELEAANGGGSDVSLGALIGPSGRVLPIFGFGSVGGQQVLIDAVPDPAELAASGDIVDVDVADEPYRVAAVELKDGSIIVAAGAMETVKASVTRLIHIELVVGIVLMVVLAAISLATARRRLRPLEDMVETASAIAEGDMSRRVAARGRTSSEVEQLRTALNAMLQQIEIAFQTRERLNAQLRNFAADASHELRTPLASVQGYLQLYDRGMLTEEEIERARERIRAETDRMARLVDQLLALARLDQQPELRLAPVDLAGLVRDATTDLGVVEPDRPLRIEIPDDPVVVRGDDAQLRQVVGNLLSNVRVHTPTDAAVTVTVTPGGRLRIADEGPGMRLEDAARVFDRFFRAGSDRSDGSGLGLSIVEAVVESHGGSVDVDTAPGEGTTVTVTLPVVGA